MRTIRSASLHCCEYPPQSAEFGAEQRLPQPQSERSAHVSGDTICLAVLQDLIDTLRGWRTRFCLRRARQSRARSRGALAEERSGVAGRALSCRTGCGSLHGEGAQATRKAGPVQRVDQLPRPCHFHRGTKLILEECERGGDYARQIRSGHRSCTSRAAANTDRAATAATGRFQGPLAAVTKTVIRQPTSARPGTTGLPLEIDDAPSHKKAVPSSTRRDELRKARAAAPILRSACSEASVVRVDLEFQKSPLLAYPQSLSLILRPKHSLRTNVRSVTAMAPMTSTNSFGGAEGWQAHDARSGLPAAPYLQRHGRWRVSAGIELAFHQGARA